MSKGITYLKPIDSLYLFLRAQKAYQIGLLSTHSGQAATRRTLNRRVAYQICVHTIVDSFLCLHINCMPSKFNYFVEKEQSSVSPNHFTRYLEVVKKGCDGLKTVE